MTDWSCPDRFPSLTPGQVQVWRVALDLGPDDVADGRRLLSPDELTRADRYVFDRSRRNFTVCRSTLRSLLGRYLGQAPAEIAFRYGAQGKPELQADTRLRFNVSHCDPWALIGVTLDQRIGVDIERRRPISNMDDLAELCFSPRELDTYARLAGEPRSRAFFEAWTRKEAFIKTTGRGLTEPLREFDVAFGPGEAPRVLRVAAGEVEPERWSMWSVDAAEEYAGAVTVDEAGKELVCLEANARTAAQTLPD